MGEGVARDYYFAASFSGATDERGEGGDGSGARWIEGVLVEGAWEERLWAASFWDANC